RRVARHAFGPSSFGLDEPPCLRLHARPVGALREYALERSGERIRRSCFEKEAGLAVAHKLPMPADVGRHEHATLRHCLERLERRNKLGQTHAPTRIREHIDTTIVALHLLMRDTTN